MSETLAVAAFAGRETNRALRTDGAIAMARALTAEWGLPQHGDRPKAWDNLLAVYWASKLCDPDAVILDAGAGDESAFLPGLARLGYQHLIGCNTDDRVLRYDDPTIVHRRADITAMPWADKTFGFIACLSVIEHGVAIDRFMREAARVLKPGGHLFISTDYWDYPRVDCGGRHAFGAPVRVFDALDMHGVIGLAEMVGFKLTSAVDLRCQDRTVNWIGLSYTFINVLFRKAD